MTNPQTDEIERVRRRAHFFSKWEPTRADDRAPFVDRDGHWNMGDFGREVERLIAALTNTPALTEAPNRERIERQSAETFDERQFLERKPKP